MTVHHVIAVVAVVATVQGKTCRGSMYATRNPSHESSSHLNKVEAVTSARRAAPSGSRILSGETLFGAWQQKSGSSTSVANS
ncbi:hypothetical protein COCC4DRAFT_186918 [Bipolaris maydis ATCC 48331]|uniref:Secreted protein n=2 Tax=Cochliobolus heterostrophus TaxID=5016 RepID=M2SYN2_COCH5|nr:uncharacterized protein COCC4DRAFT_186918 [Bipolaris maydis ATCC 48331]EMD90480.1 hypothetical protein COCHEDRAFT_1179318 [Bipolaris maydis C5]KAJ5023697.1 hypothetical protein J3E73DRAFT_333035 [Bipolaris maydis]ENI09309.1 hypothetical protein COCC4DRAFT_186918 [Bipolaris maydis ATCC 48331]KAJ5058359.1 hypothetical protein J3E74DRAFT_359755 [Bipolaris maydis]KAJ6195602.1 hypothetical protein J3E72DRAFT_338604 [Bipolaris maydis]